MILNQDLREIKLKLIFKMDIIYLPLLQNNNWIILVFVLILSLLVVLKKLFKSEFKQQITTIFKKVWLEKITPEYAIVLNFYNFIFVVILSLCLAFIILYIQKNFIGVLPENDFYFYLKTSGIILLFFILKLFLNLFFSLLFNLNNIILKIIYIKSSYLNFLTLVLIIWLPFIFFMTNHQVIIFYFGMSISLILSLYFYFLILKINLKLAIKYFVYFILYLCTLEIAPIILLYSVFISKN